MQVPLVFRRVLPALAVVLLAAVLFGGRNGPVVEPAAPPSAATAASAQPFPTFPAFPTFPPFPTFPRGAVPAPTPPGTPERIEAPVERVIDGSTLEVRIAGSRAGVGYLGAEAPQGNTPCGRLATARNTELAGVRVFLEADPAYERDALGRRLFYAFSSRGELIDAVLVREGLARAVRPDGRYGAELAQLEVAARAAGRGCLWGASGPPAG